MQRFRRVMIGTRTPAFAHPSSPALAHSGVHARSLARSPCAAAARSATLAVALLGAACQSLPPPRAPAAQSLAPPVRTLMRARFEPALWSSVPAIADADLVSAWPAWLASCRALDRVPARREAWSATCASAAAIDARDARAIRVWLTARLDVYRVLADERISDVLGAESANLNSAADTPANATNDTGAGIVAEFTHRGRITR